MSEYNPTVINERVERNRRI